MSNRIRQRGTLWQAQANNQGIQESNRRIRDRAQSKREEFDKNENSELSYTISGRHANDLR
jgi:hypothetical protein